MNIENYDKAIAPHLANAREYAYRAAREISRLPARPAFFTLAEDELDRAERETAELLKIIQTAKQQYAGKPLEI